MRISLIIVAYSLIFLFLVCTFLFFYIVVRRIVVNYQERSFKKKYRRIEKDILDLITYPQQNLYLEIARKYKAFPIVLTQVLFDYIEQIEGQGRDQLKKVFDYALKVRCLKDIYSRRLVKRLRATHLFVVFSDPSETVHIMKLLNDKPLVRLVAVNALSRIRSSQAIAYIFQAFENDTNANARTYINIMAGLGQKIEHLVRIYLRKPLPVEKLGLLIELVSSIPLRSLYDDITEFSDHFEKDIRTKVARALGNFMISSSYEILAKLSQDETWVVRAQAVKSMGKLRDLRALDTLTDALFSPFWHVRYNAGFALAGLGLPGIKRLQAVSRQKEDEYAADMARMVMGEIIYSEDLEWVRL